MMKIELIFILFSYIIADPFESWIEYNKHIFDEEYKKVSFSVSIGSNILSKKIDKYTGEITIGEDKKFRYKMGSRTVVSNGTTWKNYDQRTGQIFIQEPNKRMEKVIFSWIELKKIKTLPIKYLANGEYKLNIFNTGNDIRMYFNINSSNLDSITINQKDGIKSTISNIKINRTESLNLIIGTNKSTVFDLR